MCSWKSWIDLFIFYSRSSEYQNIITFPENVNPKYCALDHETKPKPKPKPKPIFIYKPIPRPKSKYIFKRKPRPKPKYIC